MAGSSDDDDGQQGQHDRPRDHADAELLGTRDNPACDLGPSQVPHAGERVVPQRPAPTAASPDRPKPTGHEAVRHPNRPRGPVATPRTTKTIIRPATMERVAGGCGVKIEVIERQLAGRYTVRCGAERPVAPVSRRPSDASLRLVCTAICMPWHSMRFLYRVLIGTCSRSEQPPGCVFLPQGRRKNHVCDHTQIGCDHRHRNHAA